MNIERAKLLDRGDKVWCPADRGSPSFQGTVVCLTHDEHTTPKGTKYIWITVKRPGGRESVWPSNRLG